MRAWVVTGLGGRQGPRIRLIERAAPEPAAGELLLDVSVCGVCRTDLHVTDGDLPAHTPDLVPGHEIVGRVAGAGPGVDGFDVGERVGVAWLRRTCGTCRWCRIGAENLCPASEYTGWDADGGYAEQAVVPASFAYRLPASYDDERAAPLLCAGIIGYRALRRASLPPGGRLGVYGFGASAHITAQIALHQGAELHVMTRGASARALAGRLGAASVGGPTDQPPVPLDAAIVFAPAGELVPLALEALDRGGTLALAGIHMSDLPALDYARHLFYERDLRSVTSNTRADGDALFRLADRLPLEVHTTSYDFEAAEEALGDLAAGAFSGAAVIRVSP